MGEGFFFFQRAAKHTINDTHKRIIIINFLLIIKDFFKNVFIKSHIKTNRCSYLGDAI